MVAFCVIRTSSRRSTVVSAPDDALHDPPVPVGITEVTPSLHTCPFIVIRLRIHDQLPGFCLEPAWNSSPFAGLEVARMSVVIITVIWRYIPGRSTMNTVVARTFGRQKLRKYSEATCIWALVKEKSERG